MPIDLYNRTIVVNAYNGVIDTYNPQGEPLPPPNLAPTWRPATPTSINLAYVALPYTLDMSTYASDPNDDALTFSLVDTRTGISISPAGILTITTDAAGTSGNITVRASDGTLTTDATCAVTVAAAGQSLDYHPGHYITTGAPGTGSSGYSDFLSHITTVANYVNARSYIKGLLIRPFWEFLETSRGVYDWEVIDHALSELSTDKYLWVQLQTATFSGGDKSAALLPAYMLTSEFDGGAFYDAGSDDTKTKVWNAAVMDRKIALLEAMAARYNENARFEGVVTGETAQSLTTNQGTSNYSPSALATQLERLFPAARAAFTRKQLCLYINYISGSGGSNYFQPILDAARASDYVVGGPDSLYLSPTTGRQYINGTLGTTNYRGKIGIQVGDQYSGLTNASYTASGLFSTCFTSGGWGANYGFWMYLTSAVNWTPIMNYIQANQPACVTTYPSEYP